MSCENCPVFLETKSAGRETETRPVCISCRHILAALDKLEDEMDPDNDFEYEFHPAFEEYDPYESPEEVLQREWENKCPDWQFESFMTGEGSYYYSYGD